MIETAEKKERFILAAASDEDREDVERSLDELSDLLDTDGGEEAGRILQLRERWDKRTYLGKGKSEGDLRRWRFRDESTGEIIVVEQYM